MKNKIYQWIVRFILKDKERINFFVNHLMMDNNVKYLATRTLINEGYMKAQKVTLNNTTVNIENSIIIDSKITDCNIQNMTNNIIEGYVTISNNTVDSAIKLTKN